MGIFDVFVAVIWGIVEGITEWLPVSSTGHMILVEEFLKFQDEQFSQMFLVVVQLGAILAVVLLFWSRIWPFRFTKRERGESIIDWKIMQMWFKIIVACLPAAIVGILFDDWIDEVFYNAYVVAGGFFFFCFSFLLSVPGMLSGHERRPGRGTHRTAGICLCEAHSLAGHVVQMGCLNIRLAVATQVTVAHVITHDVDDVRTGFLLSMCAKRQTAQSGTQQKQVRFHVYCNLK